MKSDCALFFVLKSFFFLWWQIGGSDLSISTTQDAISFSTLNQSQSSIATFRFSRQFFTKFWLDHPIKVTNVKIGMYVSLLMLVISQCKVNLRQMLLAFRSLARYIISSLNRLILCTPTTYYAHLQFD